MRNKLPRSKLRDIPAKPDEFVSRFHLRGKPRGITARNKIDFSEKNLREILEKEGKTYYDIGEEVSQSDLSKNTGLQKLIKLAQKSESILECGCGAGSTLSLLWHKNAHFTGIDISNYAIEKAKIDWKDKNNISFVAGNAQKLPFKNSSFDLVYSAYVIEHVLNPEKMVDEMVRVTKKSGLILIICPNYGSPIEFSPCFSLEGLKPLIHAIKLFLLSHYYILFPPSNLAWNKVKPIILKTKKFFPDSDTTVEPYIQTLIPYLKRRNIKILEFSSGLDWNMPEENPSNNKISLLLKFQGFAKKIVKILGKRRIPPYKYYGSTLFVVGKKL